MLHHHLTPSQNKNTDLQIGQLEEAVKENKELKIVSIGGLQFSLVSQLNHESLLERRDE